MEISGTISSVVVSSCGKAGMLKRKIVAKMKSLALISNLLSKNSFCVKITKSICQKFIINLTFSVNEFPRKEEIEMENRKPKKVLTGYPL
jgi:hypothetical protein